MANLHPYITVWFESTMRIPNTAHTSRPWRIHELTRDFQRDPRVTADWVCSSFQLSPSRAGDPPRFRTETMKTTTTLLDVLPEFAVNVFSGWLRRDFLHRIARIAEGSA